MRMFSKKRIYLDYASSTPVLPVVVHAMRAAEEEFIGNPSAIHGDGVKAKNMLEKSRHQIAEGLGCKAREIIFTSGITESNNLAILGCARKLQLNGTGVEGTHLVVSSMEHASVLECFGEVERLGGMVSHATPDVGGRISPATVSRLLRQETVFVSIGWANNEIGVVQPLSAISRVLREHEEKHGTKVIFHSDAGQGPLYLAPQVHTLGVDIFALGGGKLYGPHGISALYVGNRAQISPLVLGGGQERGLRAGTENVALAAGLARAVEEIERERERESKRLKHLRDDFAREIVARIKGVRINGNIGHMLPNILNISIPAVNAEYLLLALDREGIALSTKSSCSSGAKESHVVSALGGPNWRAENTLRFSLGRDTTAADLRHTTSILVKSVNKAASL